MRLGFGEILVLFVLALVVFGPSKIPQLGEALGKGIRNFQKATSGDDDPSAEPRPKSSGELPSRR